MKTTPTLLILGMSLALAGMAGAQVFNSGSSGAMGNWVVTNNQVWPMPDNGQFHLNSLVVPTNATLTFLKPASGLNPPVYLLARSNVTIHGTISVDGQAGAQSDGRPEGGPGGFAGGAWGTPPASSAGDGLGPGRGIWWIVCACAGGGSFGSLCAEGAYSAYLVTGPTYGNLILLPLIGGSGGGGREANPGASGGGGGGAVLIASDTQIAIDGTISARGGNAGVASDGLEAGGGSGGAIRLVAPIVIGNGTLDVSGGSPQPLNVYALGGNGRVRIDRTNQTFTLNVVGNQGTTPPYRIGRNPAIFPTNAPRLAILKAADVDISEGTNAAVVVTLPNGSPQEQTVILQARNFTGEFKVYVETTPENGRYTRTPFQWNVGTNSLATTNVIVKIPGSTPTRITAWAEVAY